MKYLIGQKFVGQNFRRTKHFDGQNFRHQDKISTILSDEFLSLLCLRNTRPKSNLLREPVVGDVVLIQEGATRSAWKFARIVELSKGKDGQVRSALVKLGQTQNLVRQPIVSLYPLELSDKVDC